VPEVQDFVPIEEDFEEAGSALVSGGSSWLTDSAAQALSGAQGVTVEFGDPRMIDRSVVVPVRWAARKGPFTSLDADLRLEPMPSRQSHLSLAGTYEESPNGHDAITDQHLTETSVRRFLVEVAATLERRRSANR
jgi:hypothetical protein